MTKRSRLLAFLLILLLLTPITAVHAEAVTLRVSLSGVPAEEGADPIPLSGAFRVWQNGLEAGTVSTSEPLTLPFGERLYLEPLPETIAPGWDLSAAYVSVNISGRDADPVEIVLHPLSSFDAPPESVVTPGTEGTDGKPEDAGGTEEAREESSFADVLPTPPPAPEMTAAPEIIPLSAGDHSASLRVIAFNDKNDNGLQGYGEGGVEGITLYLYQGDTAVAQAVTGQDGEGRFEALPAGEYRLRAILPEDRVFTRRGAQEDASAVLSDPDGVLPPASAFDSSITGDEYSPVFTLDADTASVLAVGSQNGVYVSGICWLDLNEDGFYTKAEPVVPGVRVTLQGQKNGLFYEAVSDAEGIWTIHRVRPAFYTETAFVPDGLMFTRYTASAGKRSIFTREGARQASRTLDLNDKQSRSDQYVGFALSARVEGYCYLDENYNGLFDAGEKPLAGVKMTAIKQAVDEEIAVTFSDETGYYAIEGLRKNTYKIRSVMPEDGSTFTVVNTSDPLGNRFQSRPDRRENFWTDFVLASGETRRVDVGGIYPATVRGTVYYDDDFSGTLTGNEKIISGFLVSLVDADGQTVASDKANVKGVYELTGIVPGDYTLSVTALKGYAFTRRGEGNVVLNRTGGEGYSEPFHVALGSTVGGMDIGLIRPGTVEGFVFADRNDNGLRDGDEAGLPGVRVRLVGAEDAEEDANTEFFSAEIGTDGRFLFDAVMPGRYQLEYILPSDAIFASVRNGGNTFGADGDIVRTEAFSLSSGGAVSAPLCGALTLGEISGIAFRDPEANGMYKEGDATSSGFTVTLTPSRADLSPITAVTGENGAFVLNALHPDEYVLTVTAPEGFVLSRTEGTTLPLAAGEAEQSAPLTVAMGQRWTDQQLGAVIPASLTGRFFLDENYNGRFDEGEQTPAGRTVTITDDITGRLFAAPQTDTEGWFRASGMIPGTFTLSYALDERTFAPPEGDSSFTPAEGALVLSGISFAEGENRDGILLGVAQYTTVSGQVWIDRGGEILALPGAEIALEGSDGTEVSSVVTGENGTYVFDRLLPGQYMLSAVLPEGSVVIEPGDSRLQGELRSVLTRTLSRRGSSDLFELRMGQDRTGMDIGCVLPGRIGDFAWLDLNGDGLQSAGEGGLSGVHIEVTRDGETVAETDTDVWGFWRVSDLYPATYVLRVTPPTEVKPTRSLTSPAVIISSLQEAEDAPFMTREITVESDRSNFNVDLGFILRRDGAYPAGYNAGPTQDWTARD